MIVSYICVLLAIVAACFSQVLLKKSSQKKYSSFIREYLNILVISGYFLLFLSMFLNVIALRKLPLITVTILEGLSYTLVMLLSFAFFKEKITWKKVVGNLIIIVGIIIFVI